MRSKKILAALLIGGLALVGCSSDNDDNHTSDQQSGMISKALLDQSDVVITNKAGAQVVTGVKTSKGNYTFTKAALKDGEGPFTIAASGGVLMDGKNTAFNSKLESVVSNAEVKQNVNMATHLAASLFKSLPADQQIGDNIDKVKGQAASILNALVSTVFPGEVVNETLLFDAPSLNTEAVFLAALASLGNSQNAGIDAAKLENSVNALVTKLVDDAKVDGVVTFAQMTTLVGTAQEAADKLATENKVDAVRTNVAEAVVANGKEMANAGVGEITMDQVTEAGKAVENGKQPAKPAGTPDPSLLVGWLAFNGNNSMIVKEWHVNNSSAKINVSFKGSFNASAPQYSAASLTFAPAVSGLSTSNKGMETSPGYFDLVYTNSSKISADQDVNVDGTFPGEAKVYKAGTVSFGFKVVYNDSAVSHVVFTDGNSSLKD